MSVDNFFASSSHFGVKSSAFSRPSFDPFTEADAANTGGHDRQQGSTFSSKCPLAPLDASKTDAFDLSSFPYGPNPQASKKSPQPLPDLTVPTSAAAKYKPLDFSSQQPLSRPEVLSESSIICDTDSTPNDQFQPFSRASPLNQSFDLSELADIIQGLDVPNPGPHLLTNLMVLASLKPDDDVARAEELLASCAPFPSPVPSMNLLNKFGRKGRGEGQFDSPHGFCLGRDDEIIIADTNNHRIQVITINCAYLYEFGHPGMAEGCLWCPRKVAAFRSNGYIVVCDRGGERSRMQIFTQMGEFVKKICIKNVHIVAALAISIDENILVVDSVKPSVHIIDPGTGCLIAFHDCSKFMTEPSDIAVFNRNIYLCDFKGHRVVVMTDRGKLLRSFSTESVSKFPNGIDISEHGEILIGDSHGNKFHVALYDSEGNFVTHFNCPCVKVSRCCGLKISAVGKIVTLAKNNHHVLVLQPIKI